MKGDQELVKEKFWFIRDWKKERKKGWNESTTFFFFFFLNEGKTHATAY